MEQLFVVNTCSSMQMLWTSSPTRCLITAALVLKTPQHGHGQHNVRTQGKASLPGFKAHHVVLAAALWPDASSPAQASAGEAGKVPKPGTGQRCSNPMPASVWPVQCLD